MDSMKRADYIDQDIVEEAAEHSAINAFWEELTEEKQAEAEKLYMLHSTHRHAYYCKRHLAWCRFDHSLVTTKKFLRAQELHDKIWDMIDDWDDDDNRQTN